MKSTSSHFSLLVFLALAGLTVPQISRAQETVCAKVSLEIAQDVTLARQAFEARMVITNTLPADLTNLQVTLSFADSDGAPVLSTTSTATNPDAYFFYRKEISGDGTAEAPHPTTVSSASEIALVWTLIPTLTAANAGVPSANGKVYQIGARLTYTSGGKDEIVPINPDFIRVKPLPQIQLDYFLPGDVSGDNPLTPIVEPPVPFILGLRARNTGVGIAKQLSIESSVPKITSNLQAAPVQFTINSTSVNDSGATPGLVVNAGDLPSGTSAMIGWEMRSRLSGSFTSFTTGVSHSNELGGAVTALIEEVPTPRQSASTHRLEGKVVVDLPGRDGVSDFLAWDSMTSDSSPLRVYESRSINLSDPTDTGDTLVSNVNVNAPVLSGVISLGSGTPVSSAFCYMRGTDPMSGAQPIKRVVRMPDGKVLPARNAWLSRRYYVATPGASPVTQYHVHVFDWLPPGTGAVRWRIEFDSSSSINHPPVIAPLANRIIPCLKEVSFPVSATDPDSAVTISLPVRPYGSQFTVDNNGGGVFKWTPGASQLGDFPLTFVASDGQLTASRTMVLTVTNTALIDSWKARWWPPGSLDSANNADPDGDGLSNLYEYALDLDPTRSSTNQRPVLSRVTLPDGHHLALTVTYRNNEDDASLKVDMIASGDPAFPASSLSVVATGDPLNQGTTPPGFVCTRFVDPTPLETSPTGSRFVRLRVQLTP